MTRFSLVFIPALLASSVGVLCGCASARRDEPLVGALQLNDANLIAGQRVFMHNCYQCHPGGSAGLGPALNLKPLPGSLVRARVRKGIGGMPAFDEQTIPNPDLDNLVAYLKTLRQHKPD